MPKREQLSKERASRRQETRDAAEGKQPAAPNTEALKDELDALLDEVDSVLEENAAEFVAAYVQKGGE